MKVPRLAWHSLGTETCRPCLGWNDGLVVLKARRFRDLQIGARGCLGTACRSGSARESTFQTPGPLCFNNLIRLHQGLERTRYARGPFGSRGRGESLAHLSRLSIDGRRKVRSRVMSWRSHPGPESPVGATKERCHNFTRLLPARASLATTCLDTNPWYSASPV